MRIAGHTLGTPGRPLADALRLFRTAGLDAAEVIYQEDYPAAISPSDAKAASRAAAAARDEGIPIVALTPYTTALNSLDDATRQQGMHEILRCIAAAHEVGAQRVRIYAGSWGPDGRDHAAHWEQLKASLGSLAGPAHDAGVVLCVENHFGTMTQTAAETARLVRELDTPAVRVLYDQANLTFTHSEPWQEALSVQAGLVGHVHVKDLVFVDADAPFRASETARVKAEERAVRSRVVGQGILPWRDILEAVLQQGYDDVLTLEYEYRWHPQDLPDPAVGFAAAATAVRAILAEIEPSR